MADLGYLYMVRDFANPARIQYLSFRNHPEKGELVRMQFGNDALDLWRVREIVHEVYPQGQVQTGTIYVDLWIAQPGHENDYPPV